MHILRLDSKVSLGDDNVVEPGVYITEDVSGAQLLVMGGGGAMEPLTETRKPLFSGSWPLPDGGIAVSKGGLHVEVATLEPEVSCAGGGMIAECKHVKECRSLLIGRTGGLGDLTLLTPVLREIKRRWPSVKIAVCAIRELQQSIQNLPFIDELLQYPVPVDVANTYDGWIWLENAIEKNEDAKTLHSVDCIAKFIGLELPPDMDKLQSYVVTEQERQWVQWAYPKINGIRRICIQTNASARCRTYPMNKTKEIVRDLLGKQWEVFLLGAPGEVKEPEKPIAGLRVVADGATFRQRAALVESSDCFLGPDSSLLHVAGALKVPAVGLYGPFPWQVRTAYCPTTKTLARREGFTACSPCFHHSTPMQSFPANCPTAEKGYCGVLEAIPPKQIVEAIEEMAPAVANGNVVLFSNGKA